MKKFRCPGGKGEGGGKKERGAIFTWLALSTLGVSRPWALAADFVGSRPDFAAETAPDFGTVELVRLVRMLGGLDFHLGDRGGALRIIIVAVAAPGVHQDVSIATILHGVKMIVLGVGGASSVATVN